jgi:hypothetical protein
MYPEKKAFIVIIFFSFLESVNCQPATLNLPSEDVSGNTEIYGFVRGGFYAGLDKEDAKKPFISSAYSDFVLKINTGNNLNFKAFTDLRFRYGVEFQEPANLINIRESYVKVYGKRWDLTAGQQIIKWGTTDFTNPVSRLSPANYIVRSPDREDMDMGNLLADIRVHPSDIFSIEAALIPFYRSSVLIIDPVPVPDYVTINEISQLITDKEMFSYGLKTDMHLRGLDASITWFDGYDPMPGAELTSFSIDMTGGIPAPLMELSFRPYKTRVLGIAFESSISAFGIRGEAAWSDPYLSYLEYEYVPLPEIVWVAGGDYSRGNWRFSLEYSGKSVLDHTPVKADPVIGTEPDFTPLIQLFSDPGFDPEDYVRQQVSSFNRLNNYQIGRYYHSAALRIEAGLLYGKLTPSLNTMYNMTTRDLILVPEIKIRPADRLSVVAGFEYYKGVDGSLYELVSDFMNSLYAAIRIDF